MKLDWSTIFDNFGFKTVTATDKSRSAYVPNERQRAALAAAGKSPEAGTTFTVDVLFDSDILSTKASYYNSLRAGSGRPPEARIGRGLIQWAQVGDRIVLGNKGNRVMVAKVEGVGVAAADVGRELAREGKKKKIIRRANKAKGKPNRRTRTITDFLRDPYVVAGALLRAEGVCEMPDCARKLFRRDDGSNF